MLKINGDLCHDLLIENTVQQLAYSSEVDFDAWRLELYDKFIELIGMKSIESNACALNVTVEEEVEFDTYKRIRFTFESEKGSIVPCYLVVPKNIDKKLPLVITLQGHSTGFHNSVAIPIYERDKDYINSRGAFALQAVENGYIALAIEQRAMGERKTNIHEPDIRMCSFQAFTAFELGRTLVAERVWDVSKAIDAMSYFSDIVDLDKIVVTGNSGGGTVSFYSAIYDKRIKVCAPSCAFSTYKNSIMKLFHCACNYIPGAYNWFDMGDLASLIAPRPLLVIAGEQDTIFPISSVKSAYATVEKVYQEMNEIENCKLITHEKGHYWHVDVVWSAINEQIKKLGW